MYKLYAEFEDDDGRLDKYYVGDYQDKKVAIEKIGSVYNLILLDPDIVDEIGKPISDDSFSFYKNSLDGRTNGFFHVFITDAKESAD